MVASPSQSQGCGADAESPQASERPRSDRLVDFSKKPPYINALDQDPRTAACC